MHDLNDLIRGLTNYLGIDGKVHIHLSCKNHKSWVGGCWSDSRETKRGIIKFRHDIKVYLRNLSETRNLHTVIAHELIHAKVYEQCEKYKEIAKTETNDHGPAFRNWAQILENSDYAAKWGIDGIYIPDLDVS